MKIDVPARGKASWIIVIDKHFLSLLDVLDGKSASNMTISWIVSISICNILILKTVIVFVSSGGSVS